MARFMATQILAINFSNRALGLPYWPAAGSHFARPGKSAAAAAITLSTQRVNEHQIESLQQTKLQLLFFHARKMILNLFFPIISKILLFNPPSPINGVEKLPMTWGQIKKDIQKYMAIEYFVLIKFGAYLPSVLTV